MPPPAAARPAHDARGEAGLSRDTDRRDRGPHAHAHEHAHTGACFICAAARAPEAPREPGRRAFLGGALAAAAKELGTGIHIHLSQSANETNTVKRLWGMTPAQWCADLGPMDGPFFGAHMSGLDFAVDPPVLNQYGAVYSHCPSAGGAGGGTQPYPEALAKHMRVNIGIDTHSNDYVENLKLAVLYGQARRSLINATSPFPLTNPTMVHAIDGATRIGAAGLRRTDLGRIGPGAKADLVSIDVTGPLVGVGTVPREPLNNLLYAHGLSVQHVLTDGRLQVWNVRFVAADMRRITREAGRAIEKLWTMLDAEGFFG